jgi:hypothetical protein
VIEALFLAAVTFAVVPLLDRGSQPAALVAVGLLAIAFLVPAGSLAAAFAGPWLGVATVLAIGRAVGFAREALDRRAAIGRLPRDVASGFLAVGAGFAVLSRLGAQPLGIGEPIVLLTAVHFHVAGFVLLTAADRLRTSSGSIAEVATAGLIVGIPVTALGFLGLPIAGLIGSLTVASAGMAVGLLHLAHARAREGTTRALAATAGLSLVASMPLAAAWAVTSFAAVPFLPIALMAATHGTLNVVGFAIPAARLWRSGEAAPALEAA